MLKKCISMLHAIMHVRACRITALPGRVNWQLTVKYVWTTEAAIKLQVDARVGECHSRQALIQPVLC